MTVFSMSGRGKFRAINMDTADGQGVQVSIPGVDSSVGESSLVTSFSASQRENYSVAQCLNGGVFMYTFGHDPMQSQFALGVTSFLNTCDGKNGADLAKALSAYQAGRVSQSKALSTLSVGDAALRGYLVGQSVQVASAEIGAIAVNYIFIVLSPQGQEAGKR